MKRIFTTLALALALCMITPVVLAAEVAVTTEAAVVNGWITKGTNKYYYKNGKKQVGTVKIGNYYYYFYSDGRMVKNKIIGNYWFIYDC